MTPVKTTLVGCGAVALDLYRKPLAALEKSGIVRVVGLVDRQPAHAEKLQRSFRQARPFGDLTECLDQTASEWTLVLSPPHMHAVHAVTALRHGNHVLCEKPMATTPEKCEEMLEAAESANRVLAIGMIRRFFPAFATLKQLVERGELGEIQSFRYREGKIFDWNVTTPSGFTRTSDGAGGVLLDIGVHVLDFLMWLFGPLNVKAYSDDSMGGAEGNVLISVESEVGTGTVQLSWDSPLRNELRVEGTKATALLRVDEMDSLAVKRNGAAFERIDTTTHFAGDVSLPIRSRLCPRLYTQSMYCQLVQVVRAIRLGERPAVTGDEGIACVNQIESARRISEPLGFPWRKPSFIAYQSQLRGQIHER